MNVGAQIDLIDVIDRLMAAAVHKQPFDDRSRIQSNPIHPNMIDFSLDGQLLACLPVTAIKGVRGQPHTRSLTTGDEATGGKGARGRG